MQGFVPIWVLVITGICSVGCCSSQAQPRSAIHADVPVLQVEAASPFASESRQLEAAADQAARRVVFRSILVKADQMQRDPDPLVSILRNKKPEESYRDLVEYVRDNESARHTSLLPPLILAANDPGDGARAPIEAVQAFRTDAVPSIRAMLSSNVPAERAAAAVMAGRNIGGVAGAAKLVPGLVAVLDHEDQELAAAAMRSLARQTLLNFQTAAEWRQWFSEKSEQDLIIEIADRERDARREAEKARAAAEAGRQAEIVNRMKLEHGTDPLALADWLKTSEYVFVRMEALRLLKGLLKASLSDEISRVPIGVLGEVLNNASEPEELRREAAVLLAECGKPALAFPHIDRCLEGNGSTGDLKLALVRGLNSPLAAARLARMLKTQVDAVESRSGPLLEELIKQVRSVLDTDDESEAGRAIVLELQQLLATAAANLNAETELPARRRYADIAGRVCDTLVHVARLRQVDVSPCVPALVRLACGDSSAAANALVAIRESLGVRRSRSVVLDKLASPPEAGSLQSLYSRLISGTEEAMLVNLLGLYEDVARAPEPIADLMRRLYDRAEASEATLPERPNQRRTVRDGLRGLLCRLIDNTDGHVTLLKGLLERKHGDRDALGYLQILTAGRVEALSRALTELVEAEPRRVGGLVASLEPSMGTEELISQEYITFRSRVDTAVRADFSRSIGNALRDGIDEASSKSLAAAAAGNLRRLWVPVAVSRLRENADPGASRDAVAEILLVSLRRAHPENYGEVVLATLRREDFLQAVDALQAKLKQDGYVFP